MTKLWGKNYKRISCTVSDRKVHAGKKNMTFKKMQLKFIMPYNRKFNLFQLHGKGYLVLLYQ